MPIAVAKPAIGQNGGRRRIPSEIRLPVGIVPAPRSSLPPPGQPDEVRATAEATDEACRELVGEQYDAPKPIGEEHDERSERGRFVEMRHRALEADQPREMRGRQTDEAQRPDDQRRGARQDGGHQQQPEAARGQAEAERVTRGLAQRQGAECLQLALRNLHENAVQHSRGEVAWTAEGDTLWVEDKGPGIPPDELDKLGTRFFRARHRSPVGSGLGLSIVKLALAKIGAELVVSNREGRSGVRSAVVFG